MVSLHLKPPPLVPSCSQSDLAKQRRRWLERLEDVLRRVVGVEARLWLCSAIFKLTVPDRVKVACFLRLLRHATTTIRRSSRRKEENQLMVREILKMLCEKCPRHVALIFADNSKFLQQFFLGKPKRILEWFQNFAGVGGTDHQLGARALTRYAFMHRENCWHELEWKGKHSQAPATVAAKPYYFSDLDVIKTVENFNENVPAFWSSEELKDSLLDGQFLFLDLDFFTKELMENLLQAQHSDVWELVKNYLAEESFVLLCQRTFHLIDDKELLRFLNDLGESLMRSNRNFNRENEYLDDHTEAQPKEILSTTNKMHLNWIELVMYSGVQWKLLGDASFCNACASHGREVLRFLEDDENDEEARNLNLLLLEQKANDDLEHWSLRWESLSSEKWVAVKWLALEAWVVYYSFSKNSTDATSLETAMAESGISFRYSNKSFGDDLNSNADVPGITDEGKGKKRRKEHRRKKQKKSRHIGDSSTDTESDLIPLPRSLQPISWRLSLDNYVLTWTKPDVAEHLANHCLIEWMKWALAHW